MSKPLFVLGVGAAMVVGVLAGLAGLGIELAREAFGIQDEDSALADIERWTGHRA